MLRYRTVITAAVACILASAVAETRAADAVTYGDGRAYAMLGSLPVEHAGRVKPLDTVAREVVKIVYSRETIKLLGPDGEVAEYWLPVAAFLDWSVRPIFWDERDFLRIESIELKHMLLQTPTRKELQGLAAKFTADSDKKAIEKLLEVKTFTELAIADAAKDPAISKGLKGAFLALGSSSIRSTTGCRPPSSKRRRSRLKDGRSSSNHGCETSTAGLGPRRRPRKGRPTSRSTRRKRASSTSTICTIAWFAIACPDRTFRSV